MYRITVISVHILIILFATMIGIAGIYNPSAPDPTRTFTTWIAAILVFDILVILSAYILLNVKKGWLFALFVFSLLGLFYVLPAISLFVEGL
ncbi:hypothetical protein [Alkalihalophilus marmarensis]|uniref:hypothetical protein n=1 Tax=Alkalihalophilus marmarensis TaxID=521377 RepID=UPI002DB5BF34|nr:hypothetical protein [Alkalihalophilus marmarensis]MEC2074087.1 hypothetical protein [Alkalihalophilus marmarensis]